MKTPAKPTTIDPMLKPSEVEQMVGLSRQRLYVLMKDKADPFPAGVRVGHRAVRWRMSEVEAWLSRRPTAGPRNFVGVGNIHTHAAAE